jgi:hypothetical protein
MNFKVIIFALIATVLSLNAIAYNSPTAKDVSVYAVFTNMAEEDSKNFMDDMGITTEVYGNEIFFIYKDSPAFILNKKTEYLIIPDPNGGFTIESKKSFVIGALSSENVLEFSHLDKTKMKIKRYRKR